MTAAWTEWARQVGASPAAQATLAADSMRRVSDLVEFTLRADDYAALGGYASRAVSLEDVVRSNKVRAEK